MMTVLRARSVALMAVVILVIEYILQVGGKELKRRMLDYQWWLDF